MIAFFSTPYQILSEFARHLTLESQNRLGLNLHVQRLSKENQFTAVVRGDRSSVMLLIGRLAQMGVFGLESVINEPSSSTQEDEDPVVAESAPTISQEIMEFSSVGLDRLLVSLTRPAIGENWPDTVAFNNATYRWVGQAAVTHPRFFGCSIYELQAITYPKD